MPKRRKGICYEAVQLRGEENVFSVNLETPSITGKDNFMRIVCKDEAGADAVRDAILNHSVGFVDPEQEVARA